MSISLQKAFEVVKDYCNGDMNKAMQWFRGSVYEFSGRTALELIHQGKEKKVIDYVLKNFKGK